MGHPGRHRLRMPVASSSDQSIEAIGGFINATPQQMLVGIKKAAMTSLIGPASGPGWTGTQYAFSATLYPGTTVKLSGTVAVDRQGRARALVLTINVQRLRAPVTVTPPPADQTLTRAMIRCSWRWDYPVARSTIRSTRMTGDGAVAVTERNKTGRPITWHRWHRTLKSWAKCRSRRPPAT